jgi:hypothetical protein
MDGGAPEGIRMRPGEDGCLTKRKRMNTTTIHGNRSTKPSGIEMDELPFSRIRRRKNDNRGKVRPFSFLKSSRDGMFGVEGIRLTSPCTKPMAESVTSVDNHTTFSRGQLVKERRSSGWIVQKNERCEMSIGSAK